MNFLKKLFGITKENKPITSQNANEVVAKALIVKQTEVNVPEVKKQSTVIKNEKSELDAVEYLKNVIESNNLCFEDVRSILVKATPYMVKAKELNEIDNIAYLNGVLAKFIKTDDIQEISAIATLKFGLSKKDGLDYLENIFTDVTQMKNKPKDYFQLALKLAEYYLENGKADKAFQAAIGAGQLNDVSDKFSYANKEIEKLELQAKICFYGQPEPKYAEFINYFIKAFILQTAKDCFTVYTLNSFFHRKNLSNEKGFWGRSSKEFDEAIIVLGIEKNRVKFLNEIYKYAYEDFPLAMGIKKEYLTIENNKSDELEYEIIHEFQPKFDKTPFVWSAEVSKWTDKLIDKYATV